MDNEQIKAESSSKALTFGILACALCWTVVLGIVFGFIARKQAKAFGEANGGVICGKAKVGNILGLLGIIFGFVMIPYYIIVFAAAALQMSGSLNF
ncbi:MAG: hypothetical protein IKY02_05620 [Lachnospiraceae bacterium]|nr:hypothetical protein [Lachnospiraceae bacterium]